MSRLSLKKKDWILIIVILCVAAGTCALHYAMRNTSTGCVTVKVNGVLQGTYELRKDQEIPVNGGTNLLQIKNGKADMAKADCKDQLCVKQRAISRSRENIICLPNKVIVEVESHRESELDAVAN